MKRNPVLIISDTHYHNFHQYSQYDAKGNNTRLMEILNATARAAGHLREQGGKTIIHCGDVFHVRGSVAPSVLNPVLTLYDNLVKVGFEIYVISGNHDLESKDAEDVKSTASALAKVGVRVINKPESFLIEGERWDFIPWVENLSALRALIKAKPTQDKVNNLILHAPLNGVIQGLPANGLSAADFKDGHYDKVFVGHYHNHRLIEVPDTKTKLYSVGALTHQTWGDVNSDAGYVIYYPEDAHDIVHYKTTAPRFIKVPIEKLEDPDVLDNYVKVTGGEFETIAEIEAVKNALILRGAKAVIVEGFSKKPAVSRAYSASGTTEPPSIHTILGEYVGRNYPGDDDLKDLALDILGEVYD